MDFLYNCGSMYANNSAIDPSSQIWTSSSISAYRKAPGISMVATSLFSLVSMSLVKDTNSIATMGELTSILFVVCLCCFLPSAHPWPLVFPDFFSV
jgi:hypothetical protein